MIAALAAKTARKCGPRVTFQARKKNAVTFISPFCRCQDYSSMPIQSVSDEVQPYDTIPDDIMEMVDLYCQQEKTPVSMRTLMKAGRQELAEKSFSSSQSTGGTLNRYNNQRQQHASGRVLIQVRKLPRIPCFSTIYHYFWKV
jgi:hypothetical protein